MTVSRVINHKGEISLATRERVQRAIEQLGYRPNVVARSLTTQQTLTLGLMVPDITNPFFSEVVRGAEDTAWQAGYTLILCNAVEDPKREAASLQHLEDGRVDGMILCSTRLSNEVLTRSIERHPATVLVNRRLGECAAGCVEVDDVHGAMRAVHHLLSLERHRVGLLAGPSYSHSRDKRVRGYITALETTGHEVDDGRILACAPNEEGGYQSLKTLLEQYPETDGIFCYNDLVAIGALQACAELGVKVPDDLAVVGCDDIRIASLVTPTLTTLRVSQYDIGKNAVTMLLSHLKAETGTREVMLKPELVVRQSAP